jgi:hypothetical protein
MTNSLNRRNFLKTTADSIAAASLVPAMSQMITSQFPLWRPFQRGRLVAIAILAFAAAAMSAPTLAQTPTLSPAMPVDVTNGKQAAQSDWNTLGWQSFVALNWPSMPPAPTGISGQPDTTQKIGAAASNGALIPTTWLTYRTASSTFLSGAPDPGPWSVPTFTPPAGRGTRLPTTPVAPGFSAMLLDMTSKLHNPVSGVNFPIDDINEASGTPLIDQAGWYVIFDIRLNQSEYTYIQQNKYYDALVQKNAFPPSPAPATFVGFPRTGRESMFNPPLPQWAQFGATEVKAAWRVLDPVKDKDKMSRYYTQTGYFLQPDGKTWQGPTTFGLIGLHILRLTPSSPSTWFWATFEQVDNVTVPQGASFNPTLAAPSTTNGNCPSSANKPPASVTGNIPWSGTNPPVNVCRVTDPFPTDIQAANKAWQQALAGTVWANYEMVGVINPSVPNGPVNPVPSPYTPGPTANTATLANTTMETYVQAKGASCMNCHGFGYPQYAPTTSDYQVFSFLLTNADSSDLTKAKRLGLPKSVVEMLKAASKK